MRRVIYVVLDGVGIGALPDAHDYGDEDSDTLGNTSRIVALDVPFFQRLGLGNIAPLVGVPPAARPAAFVGRLAPRSLGKETTVGHWEQMGLITERPFPTYPHGFPAEIIEAFSRKIGRGVLGNHTASGTEIIAALGDEHRATGMPIVYTSADSVFQIAVHIDVVPLDVLYEWCETARDLLVGPHAVARVIARPFAGETGHYRRTQDRKDFSLRPPSATYLDRLQSMGVGVTGVGKIDDIFCHRGIDTSFKVGDNEENLALLLELAQARETANDHPATLVFSNLVDFDTAWGHRNDVEAFARGLTVADRGLAKIAESLDPLDRLVITADHGVDPTTPSTDHSREYVPLLLYPKPAACPEAVYEGEFADAGAFTFEYLAGKEADLAGRSPARLLPDRGWRAYTPAQPLQTGTVAGIPGRLGPTEAEEAAAWLHATLGAAPDVAVVLGSGLSIALDGPAQIEVEFAQVPHWRAGAVAGHPCLLSVGSLGGSRVLIVRGRVHEYEGADLSEVQMPVWSLSAWGVRNIMLTTAAGGVHLGVEPGQVLLAEQVLDLQHRAGDGRPALLEVTASKTQDSLGRRPTLDGSGAKGIIHASVPGPQYETPAELESLRSVGVSTVSMSPAGELLAAMHEGMRTAVAVVVTNVGETAHAEVLAAAAGSRRALTDAVTALHQQWT